MNTNEFDAYAAIVARALELGYSDEDADAIAEDATSTWSNVPADLDAAITRIAVDFGFEVTR